MSQFNQSYHKNEPSKLHVPEFPTSLEQKLNKISCKKEKEVKHFEEGIFLYLFGFS